MTYTDKEHYDLFMKQVLAFEKGTTSNDDAPDTLERGITLSQTFFGFSEDQGNEGRKPVIGKKKTRRL